MLKMSTLRVSVFLLLLLQVFLSLSFSLRVSIKSYKPLHESPTQLASQPTSESLDKVGFVLLAGGTGSRMKADRPKQFLALSGKTVIEHSLTLLLSTLPEEYNQTPAKVVLVMNEQYRPDFQSLVDGSSGRLLFADPGIERQGSVENGLKALKDSTPSATFVAVHDSARPLVTPKEIFDVVRDAKATNAAVLGVPCKATIKVSDERSDEL